MHARLMGDGSVKLSGIASVVSAAAGDLVFVEEETSLDPALRSRASAVIAGEFAAGKTGFKTLLISVQPRLAFARAAQILCANPRHKPGMHKTAVVHKSAKLGKGVTIDERVVIGEAAQIHQRNALLL